MDWGTIQDILIAVVGIGLFWWMMKSRKGNEIPKETSADLFEPKSIDEDGFIITEDDRYMMMLQVQPISFVLKSPTEQKMIWSAYRDWINMIPHPLRIRVESHPYDLNEYFQEMKANAIATGDPRNVEYSQELQNSFMQYLEEQKVQDQKCFIILETDYRYLQEVSMGIENPIIHDIMKKNGKISSDNPEVAKQELMNSIRVTRAVLNNVKIITEPMKRNDVLNYFYGSVNREMASLSPLTDLDEMLIGDDEKVQTFSNVAL